jgi:transposase
MSKQDKMLEAMLYCGIDVSKDTLSVAVWREERKFDQREFANDTVGHRSLIAWLGKFSTLMRVSLEATGVYSLDLALALNEAEGIEVAVLNPKFVKRFAETLRRSKTDKADAQVLAEYCRRMEFVPWRAPSLGQLQLRAVSRHIDSLTAEQTRVSNRLHAAQESPLTPRCLIQDLKRSLAAIGRRIVGLRKQALLMVRSDHMLTQRFDLLTTMPGIAQISALQLLAELALLSSQMSVRQWVANSGLDPCHKESGSSVRKPSEISRSGNRHLRRALYMPALVAIRHDPHIKAFYQALVDRHKAKMQALIAVARKMLHAIYGMLKNQTPYDGNKLFPNIDTSSLTLC